MKAIRISPSLMCADPLNLQRDMEQLAAGGADLLHMDVMDGHFVPNLGFSFETIRAVRRISRLPLDVHLMAEDPLRWLDALLEADRLAVHLEATHTPLRLMRAVRQRKVKAGLVLNPATLPLLAQPVLYEADFVLVMAVEPGFSGQAFMPATLKKVAELARFRESESLSFEIEVDGGLTMEHGLACIDAGADTLVSGYLCMFSGKTPLEEEMRGLRAAWRREDA